MTGSISSMPALTQWSSLARTSESDRVARFVKNNKTVENAHANFETAVRGMKSTDELFEAKNYRALEYVLTAYGLQSEIGNTGKLKRVLDSDLADENSLANRMDDQRFRDMAAALDFKNGGLSNLKDDGIRGGIRARYEREAYRVDLGAQNPALRQAEYFKNNIANVSDIYGVLGDRTFREVVQKVAGIPPEVAYQGVEAQARVFEKHFDTSKADDPAYIERFVQRFLAAADLEANGGAENDPTVQLMQSLAGGGDTDIASIKGIDLII
ncbi:MAG: DUF1217 domain-containing protein [Tagaea sp.]|nr:DUF1217 domain-containing protein [Tagaea sp.]